MDQCDTCAFFVYDEELEEYVCDVDMDEDDMAGNMQGLLGAPKKSCPFYRDGDEYKVVRHQM